jgi:type I restriction enzyme S subunit
MGQTRIKDITEFVLDGTHGSPVRTEVGVPVLSALNVKGGRLEFETDRYTSATEYANFRKRLPLAVGDVLLTIVGTIGRAAVIDETRPLVFQRSVAVLRPKQDVLWPRFLYHVSQSNSFQAQLSRSSNQSSQAGIYLGRLKELLIPLPPLLEQRRIADILDKADALRAKRRAALAQLDTLIQSIFLEMFGDPATNPKGWRMTGLGAALRNVTNGMTRRRNESEQGESIVLRLRDIREGWIDFSDVNRITLTQDEARKYEVNTGDLLFIRVNGNPDYVGRCAIFDGHTEKVYFNDHVMRVRVGQSTLDGIFLAFLLNGPHGKNEIAKHRKTSAGQHTINQDGLSRISVPLPPLSLQRSFAGRVAAVEKLKASHRTSLVELDALFASLQHRAFRGDL